MKNVIVVGKLTDRMREFCLRVAKILEYKFIDIQEKFDEILLMSADNPINLVDEVLKEKETKIIHAVARRSGVVSFIPMDMYLSNGNYDLLKDCFRVGVINKNSNEMDKNIEKLLKIHVNILENEENLNENEIIKKILKFFE